MQGYKKSWVKNLGRIIILSLGKNELIKGCLVWEETWGILFEILTSGEILNKNCGKTI